MRIAQIAPLHEAVPPKLYGGTERVVSYLTEELVRFGHDVTLFASGDSVTKAKLISVCETALRLDPKIIDPNAWHIAQLEEVVRREDQFDIIHFHTDYNHFPVSSRKNYIHLTTLHGRLDLPDLIPIYKLFSQMPVVSISNHQRQPLKNINWMQTIYHGLPDDLYSEGKGNGDYLLFLGRISPEKGIERAVEIARWSGKPLIVAAKIEKSDQEYFKKKIAKHFTEPFITFIGEVGENEKRKLLEDAIALLFPINWPEPFGMVMIEAMASGTPVIAWQNGSVSEIIRHGINGVIINSVDEGVQAVRKIAAIDRHICRLYFEENFTSDKMTVNYLNLYSKLIDQKAKAKKSDFSNTGINTLLA
jgi:glycosyltransferase involved in cell wall biosynthesis